jgi:hypothetical protein
MLQRRIEYGIPNISVTLFHLTYRTVSKWAARVNDLFTYR